MIELNKILISIAKELDITEAQHKLAIERYQAMNNWLGRNNGLLYKYSPIIRPQGSFLLGTVVRPISEEGDIDIDLICELRDKPYNWTQRDLKDAVGNRIKENGYYKPMLKDQEGGRRCWTLNYADDKFHMDILPSLANTEYQSELKMIIDSNRVYNKNRLRLCITDKKLSNYNTEVDSLKWLISNPLGYAIWFFDIATSPKIFHSTYLVKNVLRSSPLYRLNKYPLQRVIQLLKRHRDILMGNDEDKPISIIITTLASLAYSQCQYENVYDSLCYIVNHMEALIQIKAGKYYIPNPVNDKENFADKWNEKPRKRQKFEEWLNKVKTDINSLVHKQSLPSLYTNLTCMYDEKPVKQVWSDIGSNFSHERKNGNLKMATSGILGSIGSLSVKAMHNFHGGYDNDKR